MNHLATAGQLAAWTPGFARLAWYPHLAMPSPSSSPPDLQSAPRAGQGSPGGAGGAQDEDFDASSSEPSTGEHLLPKAQEVRPQGSIEEHASSAAQHSSSAAQLSSHAAQNGSSESAADEAFIEALRNGEAHAMEELCRRHLGRIRSVLYRVLGRDSEAQDVAQDVIVRALMAAPKFRGGSGQLEGWLTAISVNTARDVIRRRTLFRRYFSGDDTVLERAPAQLASVEQIDTIRRTYRVLDKMSADDRVAFTLKMIDQMTLEQVAEATSVSLSTAKRRVERAKKRFTAIAKRDPELVEMLGGDA